MNIIEVLKNKMNNSLKKPMKTERNDENTGIKPFETLKWKYNQ